MKNRYCSYCRTKLSAKSLEVGRCWDGCGAPIGEPTQDEIMRDHYDQLSELEFQRLTLGDWSAPNPGPPSMDRVAVANGMAALQMMNYSRRTIWDMAADPLGLFFSPAYSLRNLLSNWVNKNKKGIKE